MGKIYVGNCSFNVTEQQLRDVFGTYGEVSSVNVITDRDTGRPRGFAFVEMPDSSAAQAASRVSRERVGGSPVGGTAVRGPLRWNDPRSCVARSPKRVRSNRPRDESVTLGAVLERLQGGRCAGLECVCVFGHYGRQSQP